MSDYQDMSASDDTEFAQAITNIANDIVEFLGSEKPSEMKANLSRALKFRWGFTDQSIHTIETAAESCKVNVEKLILEEKCLVQLIGWNIPITDSNKKQWKAL